MASHSPVLLAVVSLLLLLPELQSADPTDSLIFLATFDHGMDAELGADRRLRTADTLERKTIRSGNTRTDVRRVAEQTGTRRGAVLRFIGLDTERITLFSGTNAGYREQDWEGTVSFWLKLNPDEDLAPGYCDPIQLTDSRWNDGSFFVDFDKDLPRVFRLGVFSEYAFWNPLDTPWEKVSNAERPMVVVTKPPFARTEWTHVAWTFRGINASDGSAAEATLFLNGQVSGKLQRPLQLKWDVQNSAIMLGIAYTGDFDELAIFNRCLEPVEVKQITELQRTMTAAAR